MFFPAFCREAWSGKPVQLGVGQLVKRPDLMRVWRHAEHWPRRHRRTADLARSRSTPWWADMHMSISTRMPSLACRGRLLPIWPW